MRYYRSSEHPLFPRYSMNPNLNIFMNREAPYHRIPLNADIMYEEEFLLNKEYYHPSRFNTYLSPILRSKNRAFLVLTLLIFCIFIFLMLLFRGSIDDESAPLYQKMTEVPTVPSIATNNDSHIALPTIGVPFETMQECLKDYLDSINKSESYPDNVNNIQPHHIRVIGAMGDSLTVGSYAKNFEDTPPNRYPGNAYFTGSDVLVDRHLTIYSIFRYIAKRTGSHIYGGSTGIDYGPNTGLNVAVGGRKSDDIPRQAADLVERINNISEIDVKNDWKLVSLWIGTNDVGDLGYGSVPPISPDVYKAKIEEGLAFLKKNLPRTIVSIIAMFQPELLQEAQSIINMGKRPGTAEHQKKIDALSDAYRNAVFEIQNEKKFDSNDFTVVVQPFAAEYRDAYIDRTGKYNTTFYASDIFHLSKFGHATIAKNYWKSLFEPVEAKTKKANLGDDTPTIFKLNKENSFIRTIGNSHN